MAVSIDEKFEWRAPPIKRPADAAGDFARPPGYEEFWDSGRRQPRREAPRAQPDRWPTIAAVAAILIGASALIALPDTIMRAAPAGSGAEAPALFAKLDRSKASFPR